MAKTLSGFVRVSIVAPTTEVDLALPSAVTVVAMLPRLVELLELDVRSDQGPQAEHAGWTLRRPDGRELELATDMTGNGVREGDVLVLAPACSSVHAPLFDDVVELFERPTSGWTVRDTRALAVAVFGTSALLATAAALLAAGSRPGGFVLRLASVVGPLGLAALTVLPPLALRLARVPPPVPDADAAPNALRAVERIAAARSLLAALTAGTLGVSALACTTLAFAHSPWPRALAVVLATSILLRVRLFGARRFVMVVAFAGVAATLGTGVGLVFTTDPRWLVSGSAAVALGALACAAAAGRWRVAPWQRRMLDLVEVCAAAAIVPLVLGVWQAFAAVPHLRR